MNRNDHAAVKALNRSDLAAVKALNRSDLAAVKALNRSDLAAVKALISGEEVPSGRMSESLTERLRSEHLVSAIPHGSRVSYRAVLPGGIADSFSSELALAEMEGSPDELHRSDLVAAVGDSKALPVRSCPGFPVNSFEPVRAVLDGKELVVSPTDGCFLFVCDWKRFSIPPDVIVVGVENMENFRNPGRMRWLFGNFRSPVLNVDSRSPVLNIDSRSPVLFVSRYPQSGDLVKWLQQIPNRYVHFGDLDLAGIHIFLTEFYKFLGDRSEFFIPFDAEVRISRGSRARYVAQLERFGGMAVTDPRVRFLVDLIHKHHRGYDQEGYLVCDQEECPYLDGEWCPVCDREGCPDPDGEWCPVCDQEGCPDPDVVL